MRRGRGTHRRIIAIGSRRYSVCGLRVRMAASESKAADAKAADAKAASMVAWFSGLTLLVVVSLSVYAVARPPEVPRAADGPSTDARYSVADFWSAVR